MNNPSQKNTIRAGIYRRRLQTVAAPGLVRVLLEDDPHCYEVTLQHADGVVTTVDCRSIRTPWSLCADASANLNQLVGITLQAYPHHVFPLVNPGRQCTHMLDAAALAVAHAARGISHRRYDLSVDCWSFEGARNVNLDIDGAPHFRWVICNDELIQPENLRGITTKQLLSWSEGQTNNPEEIEAFFVTRRAIYISKNRMANLDQKNHAIDVSPGMGACYVYQEGVAENALRNIGSTKDFTYRTDDFLPLQSLDN